MCANAGAWRRERCIPGQRMTELIIFFNLTMRWNVSLSQESDKRAEGNHRNLSMSACLTYMRCVVRCRREPRRLPPSPRGQTPPGREPGHQLPRRPPQPGTARGSVWRLHASQTLLPSYRTSAYKHTKIQDLKNNHFLLWNIFIFLSFPFFSLINPVKKNIDMVTGNNMKRNNMYISFAKNIIHWERNLRPFVCRITPHLSFFLYISVVMLYAKYNIIQQQILDSCHIWHQT